MSREGARKYAGGTRGRLFMGDGIFDGEAESFNR